MGNIETTYDLPNDLTVVTATGRMTADDFHNWTTNYYAGEVTSLHLWDITRADLSLISTNDGIEDAQRTAEAAQIRKGGKTAIVVSKDTLGFGLSRMSETFHSIENAPVEYMIFTSRKSATDWLGVKGHFDTRSHD